MKNQLKIGVLLSYSSIFLGLIISILYTPFMLRTLGENQYGLYTLVSSIVGYLGLLNFGFSSSYMRYYAKYKVKNNTLGIQRLNGMFMTVFIVLGILIFTVGMFLLPNLSFILGDKIIGSDLNTAKVLFFIMVLNLSIPLFTTTFNVYVIAHEKFIFLKLLSLFKTVFNPLAMVIVLSLGYESIGMSLVTLSFTLLLEVVLVFYCITKLKIKFNFKNFDFKLMREMAIFSSFIFLNMIVDQINWSVDKFLLGRYQGTTAVAIYGVASQINSYYLMFSTQISSVFIPRINKIVAKGNSDHELTSLFTRIGRIQFMILALVFTGFLCFGQVFVNIWAGTTYSSAYYVILLLIGPVSIPLVQTIGLEVLRAKNMHKFRSVVYFFIAISNVLISIPLVKAYGPIGAAFGTALAILLGNGIIINWYYHTKVGINIISFWKEIISLGSAVIIPVLLGLSLNYFIDFNNLLYYIGAAVLFTLVYLLFIYFVGMNKSEKKLVNMVLNKVTLLFKRKVA